MIMPQTSSRIPISIPVRTVVIVRVSLLFENDRDDQSVPVFVQGGIRLRDIVEQCRQPHGFSLGNGCCLPLWIRTQLVQDHFGMDMNVAFRMIDSDLAVYPSSFESTVDFAMRSSTHHFL